MRFLTIIAVFKNILNEELIRSVHVYRFDDGQEKSVEREFMFSPTSYVEMQAHPFLKLSRLHLSNFSLGRVIGLWLCIFAFNTDTACFPVDVPSILTLSRNPKLKSVPTLAEDIQKVFQLRCGTESEKVLEIAPKKTCEEKKDRCFHPKRRFPMLDQDLNCPPLPIVAEELLENQQSGEAVPEAKVKKTKKRAATEHIARIALSDLAKYFDLPIVEASRNLKVGLTVLKRKCRELGIPRWPHRKIKSLDTLIHNLQEEAERQEWENKAAAMAVAKRQRMLEREREGIERRPSMEIQGETKKFRQDVFKRRHRERALTKANAHQSPPTLSIIE